MFDVNLKSSVAVLQAMADWDGVDISSESHIVQIMRNTCEAAAVFARHAYLLADRYFLTIPALRILNEYNRISDYRIDLITKAKKNISAYEEPKRSKHRRGRPRRKGNSIKISSLFESRKKQFRKTTAMMNGKMTEVNYYKIDLLWGQGLYQKLRFVLVNYGDTSGILVSTDLTLDPVAVIEAYSKRFRCESLYRELK